MEKPTKVLYEVHPLEDSRWNRFLQAQPCASVFHSIPWLRALRRTYGYEPIAFTTSPPDIELQNGALFCRVDSRLTGRRLVSLPFSDHCDLLVDHVEDQNALFSFFEQMLGRSKLHYIEIRPVRNCEVNTSLFHSRYIYCAHEVDLRPDLDTLFSNCHKNSTQRKIRRAEKEGLTYEDGRSAALLDDFYHLFLLTRRRHESPPPPRKWFQHLIECFGDALKIRVAFKDRFPVAAVVTLRYKDVLSYKYGASDVRFNNLGGIHLLIWRTIQEGKQEGVRVLDLGRSDCDNIGLITFKDRWGATRSVLSYLKIAADRRYLKDVLRSGDSDWKVRMARRIISHSPDRVMCLAGSLFYKHIG